MNLKDFQVEHAEWLKKLYPNQTVIEPAAGMVEEAGELMHCLLKCQQSLGHCHPEKRYKDVNWGPKFVDAVGDCAIFACSFATTTHIDFDDVVRLATRHVSVDKTLFNTAFVMVANLVHLACTIVKQPNANALFEYLCQLCAICTTWNLDLKKCIHTTWTQVKERA